MWVNGKWLKQRKERSEESKHSYSCAIEGITQWKKQVFASWECIAMQYLQSSGMQRSVDDAVYKPSTERYSPGTND